MPNGFYLSTSLPVQVHAFVACSSPACNDPTEKTKATSTRLLGLLRDVRGEGGEGAQRKVTAKFGNSKRAKPLLGTNVVAALQRSEKIGKSWRGSREGG